jgi:hypothetical protein
MVKLDLYQELRGLVVKTDKKILVAWGCDCAKRVLPYFEKKYPNDNRPRLAIKAGRQWLKDGIFKMTDIRSVSLAAHAAAREIENDDVARSAARAAGQAVAATHVPTHSLAAAMYAATVIRDKANPVSADKLVLKERDWQFQHLLKLIK